MLNDKLTLFVSNTQDLKGSFTWSGGPLVKRMAALLYALEGRRIDVEAIRRCYDMIKRNAGIFSYFRGTMAICLSALLALTSDPDAVFDDTLNVYDMLKKEGFWGSEFLVVAAYEIARQAEASDYKTVAGRSRAFYDGMKKNRFFITGYDDYIYAAMLGLSDLDVEVGVERVEIFNSRLRREFSNKNSVQTLAQTLALSSPDGDAVDRVLALRDAFRASGVRMDRLFTLSSLGVLALLPAEPGEIAGKVAQAKDMLRAQRGFGVMTLTTQALLLYAAALVTDEYMQNIRDGLLTATLSTSITNIIISQQTTMVAILAASQAASSSASSSHSG